MAEDFRSLRVWQNAKALRDQLFRLSKGLPVDERFRLCDQIIRASRSVTANVAEGHGRYHYADGIRFLIQARGSLYELLDHLDVALECGYIQRSEFQDFERRIAALARGLNGYIRHLRQARAKGVQA